MKECNSENIYTEVWTTFIWLRIGSSGSHYEHTLGRAIAQAVSRWLPTAAVWDSRPGRHVGFCGGQSGARAGFLRVLWFLLPNSFHQLLQKIIFIIIIIINQSSGICTIGQMGKCLWPQYKGLIDT
jgi:hypothetical protein